MKYGLWGSWVEGNKMIMLAKTIDTRTELESKASQDLKKFEQEYPNAVQRYEVNLGE